jgi:hypothetical protein
MSANVIQTKSNYLDLVSEIFSKTFENVSSSTNYEFQSL